MITTRATPSQRAVKRIALRLLPDGFDARTKRGRRVLSLLITRIEKLGPDPAPEGVELAKRLAELEALAEESRARGLRSKRNVNLENLVKIDGQINRTEQRFEALVEAARPVSDPVRDLHAYLASKRTNAAAATEAAPSTKPPASM